MNSVLAWLVSWAATVVGRILFLPEPAWTLSEEKAELFERSYQAALDRGRVGVIDHDGPYPKWELLRYLVEWKGVLLHGSNHPNLEVLEPREQTDFSGRPVKAVFATRDALWPVYFAIIDYDRYRGSLRNACWVVNMGGDRTRRFYFFSLNQEMLRMGIWRQGTVYVLPGETFQPASDGVVRFDEWLSEKPVVPLAKLPVGLEDLPFRRQVAGHREGESMFVSWLLYKRRWKKAGARHLSHCEASDRGA